MFKTMTTLFRASSTATEEALIDANATLLLQQHIKDAEAAVDSSKRALAMLIKEKKHLEVGQEKLKTQSQQYRDEAQAALTKNKEELAGMAAEMMAQCQIKQEAGAARVSSLETQIFKLRHQIETHQERLADLRIGLQKARTNQQDAFVLRLLSGQTARSSSLKEGEKLLARIDAKADPMDLIDDDEALFEDSGKTAYQTALDEAGIGQGTKARAQALLNEIKTTNL